MKKIHECKGTSVYELTKFIEGNGTFSEGQFIEIDGKGFVIIFAVEEKVFWGKDHKPGVDGANYSLLISDKSELVARAKQRKLNHEEKIKQEKEKQKSEFIELFNRYISSNEYIKCKVSFEKKDRFRSSFPNRTKWDPSSKSWLLRHISQDFESIKVNDPYTMYVKGVGGVTFYGAYTSELSISYSGNDFDIYFK